MLPAAYGQMAAPRVEEMAFGDQDFLNELTGALRAGGTLNQCVITHRVHQACANIQPNPWSSKVRTMMSYLRGRWLRSQRPSLVPEPDVSNSYIVLELLSAWVRPSHTTKLPDTEGTAVPVSVEDLAAHLTTVLCSANAIVPRGFLRAEDLTANPAVLSEPAADTNLTVLVAAGLVLTLPQIAELIMAWSGGLKADCHAALRNGMVAFVAALTKQGTASAEWARSRARQISKEIGVEVDLERTIIDLTYNHHVSILEPRLNNSSGWSSLFKCLDSAVRPISMRLAICAEQARYHGMTGITVVRRAMQVAPDFWWDEAARIAGEGPAITAANEFARAYPYHAYTGQMALAPVRQALYPNLFYAAKRILVDVIGETSLATYGGLDRGGMSITRKLHMDALVDRYKTLRAEAVVAPDALLMTCCKMYSE